MATIGTPVVERKPVPAKNASTLRGSGKVASGGQIKERTEFVIASVGSGARLARLLGVDRSRPARWRSGEDLPSPEVSEKLLALDFVLARAQLVWPNEAALIWLESANNFLGGAAPVNVLESRGAAPVIAALEAELSGAFA